MTSAVHGPDATLDGVAGPHAALDTHRHLAVLDGLRGTAAYCVLFFHALGDIGIAASGYLMVDLFFLLSGFVIAYSYEARLRAGLPLREFAVRRVCRLYPVIVAGAVLSTVVTVLSVRLRHSADMDMSTAITGSLLSFLPFPDFTVAPGMSIFPTNTVLWSLFFELLINAVYALTLRYLTTPLLAAIVAASLAVIAWRGLGGNLVGNVWLGVPRIAAGFFGGVLLFRWSRDGHGPHVPALGLLPCSILVVAITLVPWSIDRSRFLPVYALFALIVSAAAESRAGAGEARLCTVLAALSYPLYVIHRPIVLGMMFVIGRTVGSDPAARIAAAVAAVLVATVGALVMVRYYEDPVRARLSTMLMPCTRARRP